MRNLT